MAYYYDLWADPYCREQIKAVFGNYTNWVRFLDIADGLYMKAWLSTL